MTQRSEVLAPQPSLEALASEANREHALCVSAAVTSLQHAVLAGRALLAAKEQVPRGTWEEWLASNCPDLARMSRPYMRLAAYEEMIPPTLNATEALKMLRGLPAFDGTGPQRHPPEVREEAMRLLEQGMSDRQIALALGIGRECIRRWAGRDGRRPQAGDARVRAVATAEAGRPSRKDAEARRARLVAVQATYGPAQLIARFKAVVEAKRRGGSAELRAALEDLAESAAGWAARV